MNGLAVRLVNGDHSAEVTLVLRRTVSQDVALGGVRTLDGSAGTDLEALRSSLLCLHLRHLPFFLLIYRNIRRTGR